MSAPEPRWQQIPQVVGHEHNLAVRVERGISETPGHARLTVSCRAAGCGWAMTYEGLLPWCVPPICGQDTREAGSRVTVQCALPAGHGGMCSAEEEG